MKLPINSKTTLISTATAVIALGSVTAFAGSHGTVPTSGNLSTLLANQYSVMADEENVEQDRVDEAHFRAKATAASAGQGVGPDMPNSRTLSATDQVYAEQTYNRIQAAYADGAADKHPGLLATAQTNYDCWLQEAEEGYQLLHVWRCQDAANAALDAMEKPMMAKLEPKPARADTVIIPEQQDFTIYFDFDSAALDARARNTASGIASAAGDYPDPQIYVTGHADTSGSKEYNMALSARRADAVSDYLNGKGIPARVIGENAVGEVLPAVNTGDGVREPLNRRVTVSVRNGQ